MAYKHESRKSLLDPELPPGGYHHREGLAPVAGTGKIEGSSKMYIPNTLWTWSFMLTTLAQAIVVLAIEA